MAITNHSIEHVVEDGLCHRCGACVPICPVKDCITFDDSLYPQVNAKTCIECGLCEQVCSGDKLPFDLLKSALVGSVDAPAESALGGFHQPWICHANNQQTRHAGASGGVVTQLLIRLLEVGEINGAVVMTMDDAKPWQATPLLARTPEEIRAASGSKYTVAPMVEAMRHILRSGRRGSEDCLAFVGVACHVHSLRMMMARLKQARRRIRYVIGPLCKSAFDPEATTDLLRANKIAPENIDRFEFRGGQWPGVMRARTNDGREHHLHQSNFRDGAYNYMMRLYTQPRCHLCYDFSNELADLSVGDPWSLDKTSGKYTHEGGHTLVIPRTEAGQELVELMQHDESFTLESPPHGAILFHQRAAQAKQNVVQMRISALSRRNKAVPQYERQFARMGIVQKIAAALFLSSVRLAGRPRLRYWMLRFLVSRPAIVFVYLRQLRKFGWRGLFHVNRLTSRGDEHYMAQSKPDGA